MPRPAARSRNEGASTSVLLNGLRVLESFSIQDPVLGVTEIARRVDLHKSTVSRILATLEQAGYVERTAAAGPFRLGLGLIALAGPLLADLDVRRLARPALDELVAATGETAALTLWDGHGAVVVEQVASPHQVKHTAPLGTRWTTYESASVQAFLASLAATDVSRLLDEGIIAGDTSTAALLRYRERLDEASRVGYAVNDGLTSAEEAGIAAPVRDHRGGVVAAVLLSAPRFRVPPEAIPSIGARVAVTADAISARLGYTGPTPHEGNGSRPI